MPLVPPLLRENHAFRRFFAAHSISLLGDQVALIALPLTAVLVLDASAVEMGLLTAAGLFPYLLFSLHAGAWVDRRGERRQKMIAADVGRALIVASVPTAYALDVLTIEQLFVTEFLVGSLAVVFSVSNPTLFISVVPREGYVEGQSLLNGTRAFSFVAGPTIGGLLVQAVTAPVALLLDACSYVFSALFLRSISPDEPPTEEAERGHVVAGLRFIARSPVMRSSLAATATVNFFNFVFWALFVLYVTRELDVPAGTLGLILGAGALGGVIGSVVTGRISRRIGLGPAYVVGCVLFPLPLLLVPLASGPRWVVLLMLFLAEFWSGVGVMMLDISAGAIFAALIPDRLRSRVSGAYSFVNYGVRPLGSVVGGVLGSTIGLRPTLWIGAIGALAGVLWLLPSPIPRLRDLPEPEDADRPVLADQHA
ncbi:MAG TPA: MFS transporter [Gaiellaceae bacterium]|nr:MFS transporter [Gaiellaceae bacterium]